MTILRMTSGQARQAAPTADRPAESLVDRLGHWAAECELQAAAPAVPAWERARLRERAEMYRREQWAQAEAERRRRERAGEQQAEEQARAAALDLSSPDLAALGLHRCTTAECPAWVAGADRCARCEEGQAGGVPAYPFAGVLEEWSARRVLRTVRHLAAWVGVWLAAWIAGVVLTGAAVGAVAWVVWRAWLALAR